MKKVRYAVVGAGWISQEAFMPAVDQTRNSVMTAIVSGNAGNADKLAKFYGVSRVFSYNEYDSALESDTFDAVYIALPNSLHADFAIRALQKGVHAIVEKPLAVTVAECEAMIAAARESGRFLMTAYRLHCEPGTVEAFRLIRSGAIGAPRIFSSDFTFQVDSGNHRLIAKHWGGPLQDVGIYCLNAARQVFAAEPVEAIAMKGSACDPRFTEVEETLTAVLRFPDDGLATFSVGFNAAEVDTFRVIGTEGEIEMRPAYRFETATRMTLRRGSDVSERGFPDIDHFGAQTEYFSDCILCGNEPEPDGKEGLADVRALLAIEKAAKTGRPQSIDSPARTRFPSPEMVRPVERTSRRLVL